MGLTRATILIPHEDIDRFKQFLCPTARATARIADVFSKAGVLRACLAYSCPDIANCCATHFACTRQHARDFLVPNPAKRPSDDHA